MKDLVFNLKREIAHAKSIGEYDYATDLELILQWETKTLNQAGFDHLSRMKVESTADVAEWVGINLEAFK